MSLKPTKEPQPQKATEREQPQATPQPPADKYPAVEIVANASVLFAVSPDIASAALDHAGITECTIDHARKVVKAFAERKV